MGDRVRVGEVLAAIGSIGLAFLLAFGAWFEFEGTAAVAADPASAALFTIDGAVGARYLGWFALLLVGASAAAGLVFLARVLTARTSERPMLQAPVAYAFGFVALLTLICRLVVFTPDYTVSAEDLGPRAAAAGIPDITAPLEVALGGWLGLACVLLIVLGTWFAMYDERTQSKGARARTEALLANVTARPVPVAAADSASSPDASVVADDAVPTDPPAKPAKPSNSTSTSPSGGPA